MFNNDQRLFEERLNYQGESVTVLKDNIDSRLFNQPLTEQHINSQLLASEPIQKLNHQIVANCFEKWSDDLEIDTYFELTPDRKLIIKRFYNLFDLKVKIANNQLRATAPQVAVLTHQEQDDLLFKNLLSQFFHYRDYFDKIVLETNSGFFSNPNIRLVNNPEIEALAQIIRNICAKLDSNCQVELAYVRPKLHPQSQPNPLRNLFKIVYDITNQPVELVDVKALDKQGFLSKELIKTALAEQSLPLNQPNQLSEEKISDILFNQVAIKKHNTQLVQKIFWSSSDDSLIVNLNAAIDMFNPNWIIPLRQKNQVTYCQYSGLNVNVDKFLELDEDAFLVFIKTKAEFYRQIANDQKFSQIEISASNNIPIRISNRIKYLLNQIFI